MPASGFFSNQRLSNIYDGPSYQDSNAYLDITTADCPSTGVESDCMYGKGPTTLLLRREPGKEDREKCYVPNAAIGWKQPNGFFYPPAFHTNNLFFDNVELRHYVIDPLFQENTYLTDFPEVKKQYCNGGETIFDNWTSIDRQTELNDDDGSLTGLSNSLGGGTLKQTISINEDQFFNAPLETAECGSSTGVNTRPENACKAPDTTKPPSTAKTSPYDHVATVVYHKSADVKTDPWDKDCAGPKCYGIPLFRQYLTDTKKQGDPNPTEWEKWNSKGCINQKAGTSPIPIADGRSSAWPARPSRSGKR